MPVVHATFTVERHFKHTPDRVFAAFADPAIRRRWYAESGGHDLDTFESDVRSGGSETLRYRLGAQTPFPGAEIANEERFIAVVPGERILSTSTMKFGGNTISALLATIELAPADGGTILLATVQGAYLEGADGPVLREQGWKDLFDRLGETLVAA